MSSTKNPMTATVTMRWSMDYDFFVSSFAKHIPKEKRLDVWKEMIYQANHSDMLSNEHFYDMEDFECGESKAQEILADITQAEADDTVYDEKCVLCNARGVNKKNADGAWVHRSCE